MARRKISQAEAYQMRHEIERMKELEAKRWEYWRRDYPGIYIGEVPVEPVPAESVRMACKLRHAVVVKVHRNGVLSMYAVKPDQKS